MATLGSIGAGRHTDSLTTIEAADENAGMLNSLVEVARGLVAICVVICILAGILMGAGAAGEAYRAIGGALGGVAGFIVAAVVFGALAAILDMQKSLRFLVDAARRGSRTGEPPPRL